MTELFAEWLQHSGKNGFTGAGLLLYQLSEGGLHPCTLARLGRAGGKDEKKSPQPESRLG